MEHGKDERKNESRRLRKQRCLFVDVHQLESDSRELRHRRICLWTRTDLQTVLMETTRHALIGS